MNLVLSSSTRSCPAASPRGNSWIATVTFGVLTPQPAARGGFVVTLGSGGHEPGIWMRPRRGDLDGRVAEMGPHGGMLCGAVTDARFTSCTVDLAEGDALVLYTDGLTEFPLGGSGFCEGGLARFLGGRADAHARGIVRDIAAEIEGFHPPPADDVALLVMSVPRGPKGPADR